MDLADQRAVGRIAPHAVLGRIAPAHRAPDIAVPIATQPVGHAGCEIISEHAPVLQLGPMHLEHPDMRRPAVRDAAVDDVKQPLVRRKPDPVRTNEITRHDVRLTGDRIEPINVARQHRLGLVAFIGTVNPVAGIGEPDAAITGDHDIVRRVQRFALEPIDQHGDRAVRFRTGDAARVVLAGNQPTFAVARIAVGVV